MRESRLDQHITHQQSSVDECIRGLSDCRKWNLRGLGRSENFSGKLRNLGLWKRWMDCGLRYLMCKCVGKRLLRSRPPWRLSERIAWWWSSGQKAIGGNIEWYGRRDSFHVAHRGIFEDQERRTPCASVNSVPISQVNLYNVTERTTLKNNSDEVDEVGVNKVFIDPIFAWSLKGHNTIGEIINSFSDEHHTNFYLL